MATNFNFQSFFYLNSVGVENCEWGSNRAFLFPCKLEEAALREALAQTVREDFPILNGRVVGEPTSGRYAAMECNSGYSFTCDVLELPENFSATNWSREMVENPALAPCFPKACPGTGWSNPLLLVKLTHLVPSNCSVLAVSLSHAIADGSTTHFFLTSWNNRFQAAAGTTSPRTTFRWPKPQLMTSENLLQIAHVSRPVDPSRKVKHGLRFMELCKTHARNKIHLSGAKIKEFKARMCSKDFWASTNEVLFSIVVFAALQGRERVGEEDARIQLTVNLRNRTKFFPQDKEEFYCGNAISNAYFSVNHEHASLTDLLKQFHERMRCALEDAPTLEGRFAVKEMSRRMPEASFLNNGDDEQLRVLNTLGFWFNSWRHRDWFQLTFGTGQTPLAMNSTPFLEHVVLPRCVLVIPTDATGSVSILTVLTPAENKRVEDMFYTLLG